MMGLDLKFHVSINALFLGEKIIQGDSRHGRYHGAFQPETHTPESFLAAIMQGKSFCAELLLGDCGREHHGQRWCCEERRQKSDPTHCGRPDGYRIGWHFQSSQVLALDVDSGNLTVDDLLADSFISSYATFIYPTISWTPEIQKWRVVFILTEAITDAQVYRKAATALLDRYQATDQQVKDPARLFFGMKPGNGDSVMLGNQLPMGEVLKLVSEFEDQRRELDRQVNQRQLPMVDLGQLGGNSPDERYVRRAMAEELAYLSSRPAGSGERYPNILPTTMRLESLRLSDWLAPEARAQIDVTARVLEGAAQNGSLALYGEPHLRKAIDWGIAHAEPRAMPPDWGRPTLSSSAISGDAERATIRVNNRFMREITADSIDVLVQVNQPPRIFCRGTALVRLAQTGRALTAEPLSVPALKGELDRAADFVKVKTQQNGDASEAISEPSRPPNDVVNDLLSQQQLPFPILNGFATTPVFLPGGILLAIEGYDPGSGIYLRLDGLERLRWDIPLDEAVNLLLDDVLVNFPFADEASKAHIISAILLPFVRPLIVGSTPLHLIEAPARGTGKGLLTDVISVVTTGELPHVMALPGNEDELEKRITATLLAGHSLILLDNVEALRSTNLSAVLTTTRWRGRLLGKSQMVDVPNNATWLATGNNVELSDEMNRRTALIRLDAGVEAPEERTGFKHRLPSWVMEHRSELVSACLSIVQRWVDEGMPRSQAILGRFEDWAEVMGGICQVSGVLNFLENRNQQKSRDSESMEWSALCAAWYSAHQSKPVGARDVLLLAQRANVLLGLWVGRSELAALQRFGHALSAKRDRVFGGYQLGYAGPSSRIGTAEYFLQRQGQNPRNPGNPPSQIRNEGNTAGGFEPEPPPNPAGDADTICHVSGVSGVLERPYPGDVLEVD